MDKFGQWVKEHRSASGDGLRPAAKCIGVSHATLSRVERGYMPDIPTFSRICRYYGINLKKALDMLAP